MRPSVGIARVALTARVSVTTVSNVLNGRTDRMGAATLHRVREAIVQLGYVPSVPARQLKTGRSQTIGLIVPSVANPFWGAVALEVETAAAARGYNVMFCNAQRDPGVERRYAETLLSYGVRGVIFGSSPVSFDHLAPLMPRGLIVAAFDRLADGAEQVVRCSVTVDNELGARLAVQHLIGLGHRRIASLSGPVRTASRLTRLAGWRGAMAQAGLPTPPDLLWEGATLHGFGDTEGAQLGRAGMRELLTRPDRPTAVFAINDLYALGACAGARDLGLSVPADVSVVGFDDIDLAQVVQPPLTTVRQPVGAMAQRIVAGLLEQLADSPPTTETHIRAVPELLIRGSTAPPPGPGVPP